MKVEWWWLVVVALVVHWWTRQQEQIAILKATPGYQAAKATTGVDPFSQTGVKVPAGSSVDVLTGEVSPNSATNPQGTSAWTP